MAFETAPFDPAEHLKTDEDMALYLEAALEEEDPAFLRRAIGTVARARGMTQIARDTGLSRESLYRALSETGNPSFDTVARVLKALGLRLSATPIATVAPTS